MLMRSVVPEGVDPEFVSEYRMMEYAGTAGPLDPSEQPLPPMHAAHHTIPA